MSRFDPGALADYLRLISSGGTSNLIHEAITERPELVLTVDGASTLTVVVNDEERRLAESEAFTTRSWATVSGVNFELVAASKTGNQVSLTFEDAVAGAMRRERKKRRWSAGSSTRRGILIQLAKGAGVKYLIDPKLDRKVKNVVERGPDADSWDLSGTLATDVQARRFSNGKRLVAGSDQWLIDRDAKPHKVRENVGAWGSLDFDLDVGKRSQSIKTTVLAEYGAIMPGDVALVQDDYPATEGRWLVQEYRHRILSEVADVTLTRPQKLLKEPKRTGGGSKPGETGDPNFVPDVEGDPGPAGTTGTTATTTSANPARERMVAFALAQRGDAYVWGGSGPSGWDCSGLVEGATAAAGKRLAGASVTQWGTCQAQGRAISVAAALQTRGALLFRIGVSEYNHVAISLGNGSTIEAMGSAYGVLVAGNAAGRGWTGGALWI